MVGKPAVRTSPASLFPLTLCLALFLALLGGCQSPRVFDPAAGVPFELRDGLIRVEVDAGRKVLHFMVDTGAGSTVLNQATARRLHLRHGETVPVYGVRAVGEAYRVSGFRASVAGVPLRPDLYALPLRRPRGAEKEPLDGLIGQDFFEERIVEIDYAARRIHLRSTPPAVGRGSVLPMRRMHDTLCIPVSVNGLPPQWTRLDTGCLTPLEWSGPVAASGAEKPRLPVRRDAVADVRLGSQTHERVLIGLHPKAIFADEAGLLGSGLLTRYRRVTIDSRGMKLYLEP